MKYNPNLDASIQNHRELALRAGIDTSRFTNAQLWEIIDEWSGFGSHQEDEAAFIEELQRLEGGAK